MAIRTTTRLTRSPYLVVASLLSLSCWSWSQSWRSLSSRTPVASRTRAAVVCTPACATGVVLRVAALELLEVQRVVRLLLTTLRQLLPMVTLNKATLRTVNRPPRMRILVVVLNLSHTYPATVSPCTLSLNLQAMVSSHPYRSTMLEATPVVVLLVGTRALPTQLLSSRPIRMAISPPITRSSQRVLPPARVVFASFVCRKLVIYAAGIL